MVWCDAASDHCASHAAVDIAVLTERFLADGAVQLMPRSASRFAAGGKGAERGWSVRGFFRLIVLE